MTHSPMPLRLETERLILTPEEPNDAEWFAELLNARGTGTFTVADARKRIDAMTETIETTGIGALVLRRRLGGEALGYTAIVVGRCSLDEPELAYELLPRAHGHGYATEAARALLDAGALTGEPSLCVSPQRRGTICALKQNRRLDALTPITRSGAPTQARTRTERERPIGSSGALEIVTCGSVWRD